MDSSSGQSRGLGRGAIIKQMQALAASRLAAASSGEDPALGGVRASGRGQLLELLSTEHRTPTIGANGNTASGAGRGGLRELLSKMTIQSASQSSGDSQSTKSTSTASRDGNVDERLSKSPPNTPPPRVTKTGKTGLKKHSTILKCVLIMLIN